MNSLILFVYTFPGVRNGGRNFRKTDAVSAAYVRRIPVFPTRISILHYGSVPVVIKLRSPLLLRPDMKCAVKSNWRVSDVCVYILRPFSCVF